MRHRRIVRAGRTSPCQWGCRVSAAMPRHVIDVADQPFGYRLSRGLLATTEAALHREQQHFLGLLGRMGHPSHFADGQRRRRFTNNVLTRFQSRGGQWGVQMIRDAEADHVHELVIDQFLSRSVLTLHAELPSQFLTSLRDQVCHRIELKSAGRLIAFRVGLAPAIPPRQFQLLDSSP